MIDLSSISTIEVANAHEYISYHFRKGDELKALCGRVLTAEQIGKPSREVVLTEICERCRLIVAKARYERKAP